METTTETSVNFDDLQPVMSGGGSGTRRVFAIVGKKLDEKQKKAGYYKSIMSGDKLDGLYAGSEVESQYNTTEIKLISSEDDSEVIIKSCASLKRQLETIPLGAPVRLVYNGKEVIKKGPRKGKEAHNWAVYA